MRRSLALCLALAVLVAAGLWPREQSGIAAAPSPAGRVVSPAPPAMALPLTPPPDRNLFAFADAAPASVPDRRPIPTTLALEPSPGLSGVRLVGFVRRNGQTLVALAVSGDVAVLAVGEEYEGVWIEAADEEAGVDVRLVDGTRQHLSPRP